MRTWSIRPLKYWPQIGSLPIVSGLVELVIAPLAAWLAASVPFTYKRRVAPS